MKLFRELWKFYSGFKSKITLKMYKKEKARRVSIGKKYKLTNGEIDKVKEVSQNKDEKIRMLNNRIKNLENDIQKLENNKKEINRKNQELLEIIKLLKEENREK